MVDETEAETTSLKYQSLFPEIQPLSSRDLLHDTFSSQSHAQSSPTNNNNTPQWTIHGKKVILVDVRSRPEREVSIISGAISIDEFRNEVLPSLQPSADVGLQLDDEQSHHHNSNRQNGIVVATYCTIGYRSGVEARKLVIDYPSIFSNHDDNNNSDDEEGDKSIQIYNMDGIVPFANSTLNEEIQDNTTLPPLLIEPISKQSTNRVHVYGSAWEKYLSTQEGVLEPVVFSKIHFLWRGISDIGRSFCLRCGCCNGCIK